jgi:acetyl-CoA synthetase (ADP-forming)
VRLRIQSEEEAARAFDEIARALRENEPKARFEGVTVERMVEGGVETIVGMTRDPSFGPVVLFGLGGVTVELLRDVSLRVAPLTDTDADEMLREIRGFQLLEGYRGAPPVNQASLRDILHRVSLLALENPEIGELDLNPVLAFAGETPAVALDARLKLAVPAASDAATEHGEAAPQPAGAA